MEGRRGDQGGRATGYVNRILKGEGQPTALAAEGSKVVRGALYHTALASPLTAAAKQPDVRVVNF